MQGQITLVQPDPNLRTIRIDPCCLLGADLLTRVVQQLLQRSFPMSRPLTRSTPLGQVSLGTVTVNVPTVTVMCQPSLSMMLNIPVRWSGRLGSASGRVLVSGSVGVTATVDLSSLRIVSAMVCVTNPRIVDINFRNVPGEAERAVRDLINASLIGRSFCSNIIR